MTKTKKAKRRTPLEEKKERKEFWMLAVCEVFFAGVGSRRGEEK